MSFIDIEDIGNAIAGTSSDAKNVFNMFSDDFAEAEHSKYHTQDKLINEEPDYDEYGIPIPYGILFNEDKIVKDCDTYNDMMDEEKVQYVEAKRTEHDAMNTRLKNAVQFIIDGFAQYHDDELDSKEKIDRKYKSIKINMQRKYKIVPKKTHMYYMYKVICAEQNIPINDMIRGVFQMKADRSASGVVVFALFTHPFWLDDKNKGKKKAFSCAYNCFFCPEQPGRARSYVDGESGNDRAVNNDYDTIKQIYSRADTYAINGHLITNCEVIVLGGTFDSYPTEYHEEFFKHMYYAFNTINARYSREVLTLEQEIMIAKGYTEFSKSYRKTATGDNGANVIGLTIETRPDQITRRTLNKYREYGVTRIQFGIQHTNDRLLLRVNRGCTSAENKQAIANAMRMGFKIDIHVMPGLPHPYKEEFVAKNPRVNSMRSADDVTLTRDAIDYSFDVCEADKKMFETIVTDHEYTFDQIKIYPLQVVEWSVLYNQHQAGLVDKPYTHIDENDPNPETNAYVVMVTDFMTDQITPDKRINRNKRDIPDNYSIQGPTDAHGRNFYDQVIRDQGRRTKDIRANEIRRNTIDHSKVYLRIHVSCAGKFRADNDLSEDGFKKHCKAVAYAQSMDEPINLFVYYTDDEHHIIGFVRLQMDPYSGYFFKYDTEGNVRHRFLACKELKDCANIRELHVYGESRGVLKRDSDITSHQNCGYGTRLVHTAIILSMYHGYRKMSVIPGFGVENYYRRFGFDNEGQYMTLDMNNFTNDMIDTLEDFSNDPCIQKYMEYTGFETVGSSPDIDEGMSCVIS
jgi:histone acetyltransferase (RNA polymerase elongator complex component)